MAGDRDLLLTFVAFMSVFVLLAVISNIFVIVAVIKFKKLRSVTNVLISNLAAADILLAAVYVPQKLHDMTHTDDYAEGNIQCKVINFIPVFLITSSCYTLVCVSFERRRAIIHSNLSQMTLKQLRKLIPAIWVVAFAVSTPTLFEYSVDTYHEHIEANNMTHMDTFCANNQMPKTFVLLNGSFVVIVSFLIPLVLVFYNYICLAQFVSRRGRQISNDSSKVTVTTISGQPNTRMTSHLHKNRVKLVKMLVLVAVMFAISWVPYFVLFMYLKITGKDASNDLDTPVARLLLVMAAISTAYNVVLYVIFNNNFREAFRNMLKCQWKELPSSHSTNEH